MAGFAVASIVVLLSQTVLFYRANVSSPAYRPVADSIAEHRLRRQMWNYGWPFGTYGLFTWAQIASDRWSLNAFTNTKSVGLYQAVYQLGYYPISMASGFVNQLIGPILFSRAGDGSDAARLKNAHAIIAKFFVAGLLLSVVAALIAFLLAKPIFHLLLPPSYSPVAHLFPLVVFSAGIFASAQIASLKHVLSTDPRSLIAPKMATAILGTFLNFAGAYRFGLNGVVMAGLCFSAAYCVWVVVTAPKVRAPS